MVVNGDDAAPGRPNNKKTITQTSKNKCVMIIIQFLFKKNMGLVAFRIVWLLYKWYEHLLYRNRRCAGHRRQFIF